MKNGEPSRTMKNCRLFGLNWGYIILMFHGICIYIIYIYNIYIYNIYIFKTMNQRIGFLGKIFTGNHVFSQEMLSGVPVSTFPQTNLLN
jgi:hypothetical protein